jgi:glutathionyl-hydroquinone reductase
MSWKRSFTGETKRVSTDEAVCKHYRSFGMDKLRMSLDASNRCALATKTLIFKTTTSLSKMR